MSFKIKYNCWSWWEGLPSITIHPVITVGVKSVSMGAAARVSFRDGTTANDVTGWNTNPVVDSFAAGDHGADYEEDEQVRLSRSHLEMSANLMLRLQRLVDANCNWRFCDRTYTLLLINRDLFYITPLPALDAFSQYLKKLFLFHYWDSIQYLTISNFLNDRAHHQEYNLE